MNLKPCCILPAVLAVLLGGCADITQNSNRAIYDIRGNIHSSAAKIQEWVAYNPPSSAPQPAQTRYCYYAMADVICYLEPQPHLSNKLVGVQGQGTSGYEYTVKAPTDPISVSSNVSTSVASTTTSADTDYVTKVAAPASFPKGLLPQY